MPRRMVAKTRATTMAWESVAGSARRVGEVSKRLGGWLRGGPAVAVIAGSAGPGKRLSGQLSPHVAVRDFSQDMARCFFSPTAGGSPRQGNPGSALVLRGKYWYQPDTLHGCKRQDFLEALARESAGEKERHSSGRPSGPGFIGRAACDELGRAEISAFPRGTRVGVCRLAGVREGTWRRSRQWLDRGK